MESHARIMLQIESVSSAPLVWLCFRGHFYGGGRHDHVTISKKPFWQTSLPFTCVYSHPQEQKVFTETHLVILAKQFPCSARLVCESPAPFTREQADTSFTVCLDICRSNKVFLGETAMYYSPNRAERVLKCCPPPPLCCSVLHIVCVKYAERVDKNVEQEIDDLRRKRALSKDVFRQHNG